MSMAHERLEERETWHPPITELMANEEARNRKSEVHVENKQHAKLSIDFIP